jgi:hypothetical protein
MGFLQICAGVVLLQLSKSAKDVPDAAVFKGDLNQVREVAEQEQPETEPKADAIRGTAAIIRRLSVTRQKMEQEEARRLRAAKLKDELEPLQENEIVEWDGLRRRKTVIGPSEFGPPVRRKILHPPLGMSHFPDENQSEDAGREVRDSHGFFDTARGRVQSVFHLQQHRRTLPEAPSDPRSPIHPVALTEINVHSSQADSPIIPYGPGSLEEAEEHIYGLPPGLQTGRNQPAASSRRSKPLPGHPRDQSPATSHRQTDTLGPQRLDQPARRQFSFTNVFHRNSRASDRPPSSDPNYSAATSHRPSSRPGTGSRSASHEQRRAMKNVTEEERLGLVKGDSHAALLQHSPSRATHSQSSSSASESYIPYDLKSSYVHNSSPLSEDDEDDDWQMMNPRSDPSSRSPPYQRPQPEASSRPIYLPPSSSSPPRQITGPTRAASSPSQTLSNDPPPPRIPPTVSQFRDDESVFGDQMTSTASPDDYEVGKRRPEQQRGQGRGRSGDPGAFI